MRKKCWFRFALFMFIFILIAAPILYVFQWALPRSVGEGKYSRNYELMYYGLEENTIDILFCGSSTFWAGISPMTVWDEIGATGFVRGTSCQLPITAYYYMLEALETQSPELVVLDAQVLFFGQSVDDEAVEPYLRSAIDSMDPSSIKTQAINTIAENSSTPFFTKLSCLMPFFRYYEYTSYINLDSLTSIFDRTAQDEYLMGGIMNNHIGEVDFNESYMLHTDDFEIYDVLAYEYYIKTIELCLDKGIKVCIASAPHSGWSYAKHNTIQSVCDKYDIVCLDYNEKELQDELKLDFSTDFYNTEHLNINGNFKFSSNLARKINQQYFLSKEYSEDVTDYWNRLYNEFYNIYY